jgi:hypothetical protein
VRGEGFTGFWYRNLKKKYHLKFPVVDRRIILIWIFRKWGVGGMDWIDLAQDRNTWRKIVKAIINLWVP